MFMLDWTQLKIVAFFLDILRKKHWIKTKGCWDFPGGPVVKNLPPNEGDAGSIPGWGTNIPHAMVQLSPHATTTELTHLN